MAEEKVHPKSELVVQKLTQQISALSMENAKNYALAVEYKAKADELEKKMKKSGTQ